MVSGQQNCFRQPLPSAAYDLHLNRRRHRELATNLVPVLQVSQLWPPLFLHACKDVMHTSHTGPHIWVEVKLAANYLEKEQSMDFFMDFLKFILGLVLLLSS